jgi:hypothetical protein
MALLEGSSQTLHRVHLNVHSGIRPSGWTVSLLQLVRLTKDTGAHRRLQRWQVIGEWLTRRLKGICAIKFRGTWTVHVSFTGCVHMCMRRLIPVRAVPRPHWMMCSAVWWLIKVMTVRRVGISLHGVISVYFCSSIDAWWGSPWTSHGRRGSTGTFRMALHPGCIIKAVVLVNLVFLCSCCPLHRRHFVRSILGVIVEVLISCDAGIVSGQRMRLG